MKTPMEKALEELRKLREQYGTPAHAVFTGESPSSQWNYTADKTHNGDASQWVK